jgi:hypothetical protein
LSALHDLPVEQAGAPIAEVHVAGVSVAVNHREGARGPRCFEAIARGDDASGRLVQLARYEIGVLA